MFQEMCGAGGEYYWFYDDVHFVSENVFSVNTINKNIPTLHLHSQRCKTVRAIYVLPKTISGVGYKNNVDEQ